MDRESVMKALLQVKNINESQKAKIEACILFEETLNFSNKEGVLSKLRESLYRIKTTAHLCDMIEKELEKDCTNPTIVQTYINELEYEDSQLKDLIDEYTSLRIKVPVEEN